MVTIIMANGEYIFFLPSHSAQERMFIVLVMGMQTQSLQIYMAQLARHNLLSTSATSGPARIFRTEARGETSSGAFGTSLKAPLPLQDY